MQPRKLLYVKLLLAEIINDVEMNTVKTADTVNAEETSQGFIREARAKLQVGGTDGDEVIAMRLIGDAASQLRSKFPDYLQSVVTKNDDKLANGTADLIIEFSMPYRWNEATMDSLTTACHRYVVNKSIERWQRIVNRTDFAENYARESNEALDDIRVAINSRKKPERGALYDVSSSRTIWYVYRGVKKDGDESELLHAEPEPDENDNDESNE